MAPPLTDPEKHARRKKVVAARRKHGKDKPRLRPLPPRRAGEDGRYKEFKVVQFHDESIKHRLLSVTRKNCDEAGRIMRREADQLLHYVSQRKEMLIYEKFPAHDWRIGSGPVESECRAVSRRIRGPGKRWDGDNAEAIMALEAADQSGQWKSYWAIAA